MRTSTGPASPTRNGNTTTFTYDAELEPADPHRADAAVVSESWTYAALNDVASYTDGRGHITTYAYDAAGNLTAMTQPGRLVTDYGRDRGGSGLLAERHRSAGQDDDLSPTTPTPTWQRDRPRPAIRRRMTTTPPAGGRAWSTRAATPPVPTPADYTTTYTYDDADRLTEVTDALGHATTTPTMPVGNRTSVTDANGHATAYSYDPDS